MNIQWFPGHMAKTKRQIAEKLKIIDLVVEVVDARAPRSTKNPDFDQLFLGRVGLTILNKSDLASEEQTKKWLAKLSAEGQKAIAFSCVNNTKAETIVSAINAAAKPIVDKYATKGVNKTVRCMVAGVPNVGKSAVLNRLAGQKSAKEGNKPGLTKGLQWIKLTPHLELMDTPGLLYPKISDEKTAVKLAVLNNIREEILDLPELCLQLIELLKEVDKDATMRRYGVDGEMEALSVLEGICAKRGCILRGNEYDYERCAKMLLDEFQSGKLGRITLDLL